MLALVSVSETKAFHLDCFCLIRLHLRNRSCTWWCYCIGTVTLVDQYRHPLTSRSGILSLNLLLGICFAHYRVADLLRGEWIVSWEVLKHLLMALGFLHRSVRGRRDHLCGICTSHCVLIGIYKATTETFSCAISEIWTTILIIDFALVLLAL